MMNQTAQLAPGCFVSFPSRRNHLGSDYGLFWSICGHLIKYQKQAHHTQHVKEGWLVLLFPKLCHLDLKSDPLIRSSTLLTSYKSW